MGLFDAQGIDTSKPQSQQTTTGSTTGTVAPWAQPYVSNLLTNAQNLSADPTALQNQSYASAANMQVAPQLGQATGMATGAAQGALGTAGTALGYGQQASQAGQNYQNMATDPNSIQAYMSPYVQQALAPQLQMLNQQQAIAGQGINAQAAGQGAFGGNRATLAQGLNAQNYDLARQQAIGQGYQNAFTQAQQAQQFGSTLGLQGLQTGLQGVQGAQNAYGLGLQGANTLGQLGQNQYNQQTGIAGLQNQLGTQQYLMPQQLLQTQQSMLQGLPISGQTTTGNQTGYQAPPNVLSQTAGLLGTLGTAGLVANNAGLFKNISNPFSGSNNNDNSAPTGPAYDGQANVDSNYQAPNVEESKGGVIRTKNYAQGGLVALSLYNALRG